MSETQYPYDAKLPVAKIPLPKPQRTPSPRRMGILLAALAAGFALVNVTVVPVSLYADQGMLGATWMGLSLGLIGAEAGLLAIGAVLGPGKGLPRQMIAAALAVGFILAWLVGYGLANWMDLVRLAYSGYPAWRAISAMILVVPVVFCSCQLPLWIFRTLLRWRIEPTAGEGVCRALPQLSIAGILIATGAVAMAFASMRLGRSYVGTEASDADWWGGCGIVMAFSAGISLVTLAPCAWATLRCPSLITGLLTMVVWLIIVAAILICTISVLERYWPPLELEVWLPLLGVIGGFTSGMLGTLVVVRAGRYRLFWGREEAPFQVSEGMPRHDLIASASGAPIEGSAGQNP